MVAFYFLSTAHKVVCMEVFVAGLAPNHGVVIKNNDESKTKERDGVNLYVDRRSGGIR